jgi:hypothetical protein
MFVARYSFNPEYDVQRRWTAYMSPTSATKEGLAELLIELGVANLPPRLHEAYWAGDDVDAAIEYVLETYDIRYHDLAGLWMLVHNPRGLSCWPLTASSLDEAIQEATALDNSNDIQWWGFGWVTVGDVRYVASVSDILHIFECEDVQKENDM